MAARSTPLSILLCMILAGCGGAANLFSNTPEVERITPAPEIVTEDFRALATSVTSLQLDRAPGGAILRATGLPPTQGYWNVDLVRVSDPTPEDGILILELRVAEPGFPSPAGSSTSREVVAARFISDSDLAQLRQITVLGAQDRRSIRR